MKFVNMTGDDENIPLLRELIDFFIAHRAEQGIVISEDDITIINSGDGQYVVRDYLSFLPGDESAEVAV